MDKAVWCLSKTPGKRTSTYCTRAEGQKNNWNQFDQYRQRPSAGTSGGRTTVSPHGRAGLSSLPLGSGLPSVPEAATAGRRSENTYPPILGLSWVSVTNLALVPALEPTPPTPARACAENLWDVTALRKSPKPSAQGLPGKYGRAGAK